MRRRQLLSSLLWSMAFALVACLAMLWIGDDQNLAGGLAFAIGRLPRHALLFLGGPDSDKSPLLYALLTGLFVFMLVLLLMQVSAALKGASDARPTMPKGAAILAMLILWEIGYLLFAEMPRLRLAGSRISFFVPWHLAALTVTTAFVFLSRKRALPRWSHRSYWLAMFMMSLYALFPMTDSP